MRVISPNSITDYIDYVIKAFKNKMISPNFADIEKLSVAFIMKTLENGQYAPLSMCDDDGNWVNVTAQNLSIDELRVIIENEYFGIIAVSKAQQEMRRKDVEADFKVIEDMHFPVVMKNIIKHFEDVVNSTCEYCDMEFDCRKLFSVYIEKFILFAIRFNMVNMINMLKYIYPESSFTVTADNVDEPYAIGPDAVVTECCMFLKTGEYSVTNKLPFNCNMRDIVLMDTHPYFKDTVAALDFILLDERSPIQYYVNMHMSNKRVPYGDFRFDHIAKLFMQTRDYYNSCCCCCNGRPCTDHENKDFYHKYHEMDFHTDPCWLDKITYGNNFINGNWRQDSVGNQKENNVVTVIRSIYDMFDTCDKMTNNELADALISIAGYMKGIIKSYANGTICNWHMAQDILAVFGEIFTKTMLRLYHNNKRVYTVDNTMNDTMIPSMLYDEYAVFVEEDAPQTNNTTTTTTGQTASQTNNTTSGQMTNQATKTNITFTDKNGQSQTEIKAIGTARIKQLLDKLTKWVQDQLMKTSSRFNANHAKEIDYVRNHTQLNKEIANAIQQGTFKPKYNDRMTGTPSDITKYIPANMAKYIGFLTTPGNTSQEATQESMLKAILGDEIGSKINEQKDANEQKSMVVANLVYGAENMNAVRKESQFITPEFWNKIIINAIVEFPKVIENMSKMFSETIEDASKKVNETVQKYQNSTAENEKAVVSKLSAVPQLLSGPFTNLIVTPYINEMQKTYRELYDMYRAIVQGYQGQKSQQSKPAQ